MLRLEKERSDKTVRIKVLNRLFYIIALDGLSNEEADRLWHSLVEHMQTVLPVQPCDDGKLVDTKWFVHYLWWERQKVSVLFITGDAIDHLKQHGKTTQELIDVLDTFEKEEVKIPFCSANATDGAFTEQGSSLSRVSLSTNDDDGEIIVNTTEEICRAAFRR